MAVEDQVALTGRNTTLHYKENHLVTPVWRPRNPAENISCFQRDRVFGPYEVVNQAAILDEMDRDVEAADAARRAQQILSTVQSDDDVTKILNLAQEIMDSK